VFLFPLLQTSLGLRGTLALTAGVSALGFLLTRVLPEPAGTDMTIIALSGWGQEEDKRRSRDAGIDHHLVKPLEPAALLRLLASDKRNPIRLAAS